ncbi:hypothetical protein, partial [Mycoplasma sp. CSL7503-lung]|uniref:hypothetical protein n=1 Tax=Mycoplasma sp. CSL7503-lung TaxID=536372 RepID=UPI0021D38613
MIKSKTKNILKWATILLPLTAFSGVSASCLERINRVLAPKGNGIKDEKNNQPSSTPSSSTNTAPLGPNISSTPTNNTNTSKPMSQEEIINNFTDIYENTGQLDISPSVFNETGTFLGNIPEKSIYYKVDFNKPQEFIFKHPTAVFYYSGIKKYYDYLLQVDNQKDNLTNRLLKLTDKNYDSFALTDYKTTRLTKEWKDAITYDLDTIIDSFGSFYKYEGNGKFYDGVIPLDFQEKEQELRKIPNLDKANWHKWMERDLEEATEQPVISYNDMYDVSKNFYERTDRHFIQKRVHFNSKSKNKNEKLLSLMPVPNKTTNDSEYVNDWYNFNYKYNKDIVINDKRNYIGVFPQKMQLEENRWTPQEFYNNSIILAPFKAIQNSNITSKSLKVLRDYIHFKIALSLLKKDKEKPFLEQFEDNSNTQLQEFYKK